MLIAEGETNKVIVPYTRTTSRSKWTKTYKRYLASKDLVFWKTKRYLRQYTGHYGIAVVVGINLAKSTGELPKNAGDADNFAKAVADALQNRVVPDDTMMVFTTGEKVVAPDNEFTKWWVFKAEPRTVEQAACTPRIW